jgi:hypothetical protein
MSPQSALAGVFVTPANPNASSNVSVTVWGEVPDSCWETTSFHSVEGNYIAIDVYAYYDAQPGEICSQSIETFSESILLGQLAAGTYDVEAWTYNPLCNPNPCVDIMSFTVTDVDSDGDGVMSSADNCDFVANPGQQNFDGDAFGDVCDSDIDGDGQANGPDPDADSDGVANVAETPCGADPLDHWKEPEKRQTGPTDEDGDGLINEPLPPGAGPYDCDGDGYTGDVEAHIYTYQITNSGLDHYDQLHCDAAGGVWPTNLSGGGGSEMTVTIVDITHFLAPYRALNTNIEPNSGQERWDLVPGKGLFAHDINIADLTALFTGSSGSPPMFNFTRALGGPACSPS